MVGMRLRRDPRARNGENAGPEKRRGFLERFLFSFMGPPQLGDPNAPVRSPARIDRCSRCGHPWDEHEVVRVSTHSYTRCPTSE